MIGTQQQSTCNVELIGQQTATPLPVARAQVPVRYLPAVSSALGINVYALFGESFPTKSHKYISALALVNSTLRRCPWCTELIVPSSGNTAAAVGQIAISSGFQGTVTAVVDARLEQPKLRYLQDLGLNVVQVSETTLEGRLKRIPGLLRKEGTAYLDQYADKAALEAHRRITGPLVEEYLDCANLAGVVLPVGTGSSMGIPLHLQGVNPRLKSILADPAGSGSFSSPGARIITGAGAEFATPVTVRALAHLRSSVIVHPSNAEAVRACWWLREHERIFVGASSGLALAALSMTARDLPAGASVLVLFPDGGAAYTDTVYSPDWLRSKGLGGWNDTETSLSA